MDLAALFKEHLVEALTDPRIQDSYGTLVAEKLAARMTPERWIKTAEMARLAGVSSRQYFVVLAARHTDLRALARPKPWEVPEGKKTPDLEWPEQETLAWFRRRRDR